MRFFTEDKVQSELNLDVLTPMARVNLAPWIMSALPMEVQAQQAIDHLLKFPQGRRGLSIEWILARTDKAHGLSESLDSELFRQLATGAWDVEAEVARLLPLAQAFDQAELALDFIYTNREAHFGITWGEAYFPVIRLLCASPMFLRRLPAAWRGPIWTNPEILFNSIGFQREAAEVFNATVSEINIRAVKEVLTRLGLIAPATVCAQSMAIRPRTNAVEWSKYDGNRYLQRQLVDGRTGNDMVYFENGYEYTKTDKWSNRWEWAALVNELRNLRSHLGDGLEFVPTIRASFEPGSVGWELTKEYLQHASRAGVGIVDVWNPIGATSIAIENSLANLARRLGTPVRPTAKQIPRTNAKSVQTGDFTSRASTLLTRLDGVFSPVAGRS